MNKQKNRFGEGIIYNIKDLTGKIYFSCAACMSVYAEVLGWSNKNKEKIVKSPELADNIIVLTCQVTDLAILNDFKIITNLKTSYPDKNFFFGGCLSQRFDIELPDYIMRIDHIREDYEPINDKSLVTYEKPFWTNCSDDNDDEFAQGNLFRHMYPLRVGVGCHGKCKYCTIRTTRGIAYDLDINKLEQEFIDNENIVIIADSISSDQIMDCAKLAFKHNKKISFRNVEPHNVLASRITLAGLAVDGLLKVLHTPVQAFDEDVLKTMNRSKSDVDKLIKFIKTLKDFDVFTATNIIIDYDNHKNNFDEIYNVFDYVSWNPYWNGDFDLQKAYDRFNHYIWIG